jgi:hypothetical protein
VTDTHRITWWREGWRVYRVAVPLFFTRRRVVTGLVSVVVASALVYGVALLIPVPESAPLSSDFFASILAGIAAFFVIIGFGTTWFMRDNRTDGLTAGSMLPDELAPLQKAPPAAGERIDPARRALAISVARRQRRNYVAGLTMFMLVTLVQITGFVFALTTPGSQLLWPLATIVAALAVECWILNALAQTSVLLENATGHRDPPAEPNAR